MFPDILEENVKEKAKIQPQPSNIKLPRLFPPSESDNYMLDG